MTGKSLAANGDGTSGAGMGMSLRLSDDSMVLHRDTCTEDEYTYTQQLDNLVVCDGGGAEPPAS